MKIMSLFLLFRGVAEHLALVKVPSIPRTASAFVFLALALVNCTKDDSIYSENTPLVLGASPVHILQPAVTNQVDSNGIVTDVIIEF